MMSRFLGALATCLAFQGTAEATSAAQPSLSFDVPASPIPLNTGEAQTIVYELHLTNRASEPRAITAVNVLDADNHLPLLSLTGDTVGARMALLGSSSTTPPVVQPKGEALLYVEIDLPHGEHPSRLEHRVDIAAPDGTCREHALAVVNVVNRAPIVLGPPLEGGPWVAVHSPAWPRGHRRVIYNQTGSPRIPGRYAIDWVSTNAEGKTTRGNDDVPAEALGYGARVLAGIDGAVAATRDGMAEAGSIRNNPRHAQGEAAGNYVAIAAGDGSYVFYEHLRPGSILVKPGDQVKRGQVVGALGFSGDSTGPHLHLHVADGLDTLNAEGLPFVISSYEELGRYDDIAQLGHAPWALPKMGVGHRSLTWPTYNVVVRFDSSGTGHAP